MKLKKYLLDIKKRFIYIAIFSIIGLLGVGYFLSGSLFFSEKKAKTCSKKARYQEKVVCWNDLLKNVAASEGVEEGFNLFLHLYEGYPEFAESCHDYTHTIGENAYSEYSQYGEVEVVPETSYCGYGFYHGFIIAMVEEEGSVSKSSEFCDYANKKLKDEVPGIALDCYHGIGHGATDFMFGNGVEVDITQEMINESLDICERVARNENELSRCLDGVYHALTEVNIQENDLFSKEDPFKLCRAQPEKYQLGCYGSLAFLIMEFNENNFGNAINEVETLQNDIYAQTLIRQLSGYQGYRTVEKSDNKESVLACRNTQERLKKECFKGLIEGLTDFGEPGKEHEKPIALCTKDYLLEDERALCFTHALDYFSRYFGEERKDKACEIIVKKFNEYREYCQ